MILPVGAARAPVGGAPNLFGLRAGEGLPSPGQSLATWPKSISTGVSRPKMFTITFIFM